MKLKADKRATDNKHRYTPVEAIPPFTLFEGTVVLKSRPAISSIFIKIFNNSGATEILNLGSAVNETLYELYSNDKSTLRYSREKVSHLLDVIYLQADITITGVQE